MATSQTPGSGRHVLVIGGSFAGLGAAYTVRSRLNPEDRVTLLSNSAEFVFAPSLVWAALGQKMASSVFALEPALAAKGIDFIRAQVREVDVHHNVVRYEDQELAFDRLVIATGGRPDTQAVPGLAGQFREASWIVGEDSAMEARQVIRRLVESPGPLVVGAAQGASYLSAAYEVALTLDTALRNAGVRDRVPMTFVTFEPYLGHLGFGQTAARAKLQELFGKRNIAYRTDVCVERVDRQGVRLSSGESLHAEAKVIMPPFTGAVDIWKSAGLTDQSGLIAVNSEYQHLEYRAVYAAGVASYFAAPTPPLDGNRAPQTGYLSLRMGKAAGENVAASLGCGNPAGRPLPYVLDVRVLDGGADGMVLMSRGTANLDNTAIALPGGVAHRLKSTLERYLVWRLQNGRMDLP